MIGGAFAVFWREMRKFGYERVRLVALLAQPALWLVLMGNTVSRVIGSNERLIPYLEGAPDYFSFMACGVIVLGSLVSAVYGGMSLIHDAKSGIYERLQSIVSGAMAVPLGKTLAAACQNVIQTFAVIAAALCLGVHFRTGAFGAIAIAAIMAVLNMATSLFCLSIARVLKSSESYFSVLSCVALPVVYASSMLFPTTFMPRWLQIPADANPLSLISRTVRCVACFGWDSGTIARGSLAAVALLAVSAAIAAGTFSGGKD